MGFQVSLLASAEQDLKDVCAWIVAQDGPEQAAAVFDRMEERILSLESLPERGNHPPELERIGVLGFRELHEPPFRIIYQVLGQDVYVHAILDARRDLQDLLARRLLR